MTDRVVGYRVILPKPWTRVALGSGAEERVRELVEERTTEWDSTMPPDQSGPLRRQLRRRLMTQVEAARQVGGVDLYFPAGASHDLLVGASFVVSESTAPGGELDVSDPEAVRRALLADGDQEVASDDVTWVRHEEVVAPDPTDPEADVPTRRVSYLGARPDDPSRWVLVGFSCVGDGDPDSAATAVVVQLFDAIMATWTWSYAAERAPSGPTA